MHDGIDAGDPAAIQTAIEEVYEHSDYEDGKKAASALVSNITSTYKPLYIAASPEERTAMEQKLLDAYELAYTLAGERYYGDSRRLRYIRDWLED